MWRNKALKVVLLLVGLLFVAAIYPLASILWQQDHSQYGDAMMLSLYFTLGILLLMAVRSPAANRSLIAFAAWSSFAHGAVMTVMGLRDRADRDLLPGVVVLAVIGAALIALAPHKPAPEAAGPQTAQLERSY